jgi:hypothetical protein
MKSKSMKFENVIVNWNFNLKSGEKLEYIMVYNILLINKIFNKRFFLKKYE